jgi:hypothetical protein
MKFPPLTKVSASVVTLILTSAWSQAQESLPRQAVEKIRMTLPARSLTFLPFYFGQTKSIFRQEGVDPELIVMRPPLGIVAQ